MLRILAGAFLVFVLPGLVWALAARPALRRDLAGLAFYSVAASVALLVLVGTVLGLAGRFDGTTLVAASIVLTALGAAVAWRRRSSLGPGAVEPDGARRLEAVRKARVAATMARKRGDDVAARDAEAEADRLEREAAAELYGERRPPQTYP